MTEHLPWWSHHLPLFTHSLPSPARRPESPPDWVESPIRSYHQEARTSPDHAPFILHVLGSTHMQPCILSIMAPPPIPSSKQNLSRRPSHHESSAKFPFFTKYALTFSSFLNPGSTPRAWILLQPFSVVAVLSPSAVVLIQKLPICLNANFCILKSCSRELDVAEEKHLSMWTTSV